MAFFLVLLRIYKAAIYVLLCYQEISKTVTDYCGILSKIGSILLGLVLSDFFSALSFLKIIENNGNHYILKGNTAKL